MTRCCLPGILARKIINAGNRLTVKVVIFNEMTLEIASISMTPTFWESHKMQSYIPMPVLQADLLSHGK